MRIERWAEALIDDIRRQRKMANFWRRSFTKATTSRTSSDTAPLGTIVVARQVAMEASASAVLENTCSGTAW